MQPEAKTTPYAPRPDAPHAEPWPKLQKHMPTTENTKHDVNYCGPNFYKTKLICKLIGNINAHENHRPNMDDHKHPLIPTDIYEKIVFC